jgi:hypothetical protein
MVELSLVEAAHKRARLSTLEALLNLTVTVTVTNIHIYSISTGTGTGNNTLPSVKEVKAAAALPPVPVTIRFLDHCGTAPESGQNCRKPSASGVGRCT